MVHRPTLKSRPFWLVGVYNSVNSYIFIWGNLSNGEIFLQTFRRLFQFRETKGELNIDYFIRKDVGLGVSICLDVVSIETLDLDTEKKSVSTAEKISTVSKS